MNLALIAAAGEGIRMGGKGSKQYILLDGRPLLSYTLEVFENTKSVDKIIVVVSQKDIARCQELKEKYTISKIIHIIPGGKKRQDSVYEGIKILPPETRVVIIHDGARPFVTSKLIEKAIKNLEDCQGVVVGVPVKDTVKRVAKDIIVSTVERRNLWLVQTPQVFETKFLLKSFKQALIDGFYGTDDASLLERMGYKVKMIMGSYENIKITTPEDLVIAQQILRKRNYKRRNL